MVAGDDTIPVRQVPIFQQAMAVLGVKVRHDLGQERFIGVDGDLLFPLDGIDDREKQQFAYVVEQSGRKGFAGQVFKAELAGGPLGADGAANRVAPQLLRHFFYPRILGGIVSLLGGQQNDIRDFGGPQPDNGSLDGRHLGQPLVKGRVSGFQDLAGKRLVPGDQPFDAIDVRFRFGHLLLDLKSGFIEYRQDGPVVLQFFFNQFYE